MKAYVVTALAAQDNLAFIFFVSVSQHVSGLCYVFRVPFFLASQSCRGQGSLVHLVGTHAFAEQVCWKWNSAKQGPNVEWPNSHAVKRPSVVK